MGAAHAFLKTRPVITCPRCAGALASDADRCVACGYSLAAADGEFGAGPVWAARVMDPGGSLPPSRRAAIERSLSDFERLLPQMFFLIYLGPLPPDIPPAAFGFWLLNQAAVPGLDASRANERGVLLTVDTTRRSAALTAGYFVENHLSQEELEGALRVGVAALRAGDPAKAVARITALLIRRFRERAARLARGGVAVPPPALRTPPEMPPVFQPLEPIRAPRPTPPEAAPQPREHDPEPEAEAVPGNNPGPEEVFVEEWEIPREPEPRPAEEPQASLSRPDSPAERDPEPEPESVTGLVKKRAKAKSRQHRHRRG